ncbi:DUF5681 domain-containing protein [Aestuariibius insulae]|uniref:DUF5681 domain-containing protein n=1 Tax=Aestuariibius insulae TaxID=2058287 RepID=UPI00345EC870
MSKSRPPKAPETKKMTSLDKQVLDATAQEVSVKRQGGTERITAAEAVVKKTIASAISGSPHAQRHVLDRLNQAEAARQAQIDEEIALWAREKAQLARLFAEHREAHGEDPLIFPHPEDIEITLGVGVRLVGPCSLQEHHAMQTLLKEREALLMTVALEEKQRHRAEKARKKSPPTSERGDAFSMATHLDYGLPPRLQWKPAEAASKIMIYKALTQRELLKRIHRTFKAAGHDHIRGQNLLPPDKMRDVIKALIEVGKLARERDLSRREQQARIEEIARRHLSWVD